MGDLIGGRAIGRTSDDQINVYKSTGHAVQDIAAARLVYDAALSTGSGIDVTI